MIRLFCCDIDGTLVGASGDAPPKVWGAFDRARAAGIRLAVCSGRPGFGTARALAARVERSGWHVFQNGASVVELGGKRSLSLGIAPEIIARLVARARETGRVLELFTDVDYAVESAGELAVQHAALLGVPFVTRPFASVAAPIVRAQWVVLRQDAAGVLREAYDGLDIIPSPSPIMPKALFLNMTPVGVSKGSAVRAIAAEYGVALADVMMVGDALNDVGAMKAVGFPVAMGNSERGVKEFARTVVGDVEDGAVAEALELAIRSAT